jgi:uncharacterized membrane protein
MAIAIALGFVCPRFERHHDIRIGIVGIHFSPSAASSVLGSIAGGMITFTGFVFSILLLAVQFGSGQFSPRLLRRFLRDRTTKVAFGVFIATFVFALMVLRTVGSGTPDFVPNSSVALSLYFLLISMLLFLRLVSRTTQSLRVATVLRELGRDGRQVMHSAYPREIPEGSWHDSEIEGGDPVEFPSGPVHTVTHPFEPGTLQSVGLANVVEFARKNDVIIELVPRIGDLVAENSPLFRVYGASNAFDDAKLQRMVAVGDERTTQQDPAFVFRLLADISSKALSPGVNDPTTAIQALDQIDLLLRDVACRRLDTGTIRDSAGTVRLVGKVPSWEDLLSLALVETHQFGASSVQVMRRMRALLADVRDVVPDCRRPAIDVELAAVNATAARSFPTGGDQLAAAATDRQGLGSTGITAGS